MVQPQLLGGDDGEILINAVIVNWPAFDILTFLDISQSRLSRRFRTVLTVFTDRSRKDNVGTQECKF